jgi:hypothetical protein
MASNGPLRHEMLELPFQTSAGLAWVLIPRSGISNADAERMAEMIKSVVYEPASTDSGQP